MGNTTILVTIATLGVVIGMVGTATIMSLFAENEETPEAYGTKQIILDDYEACMNMALEEYVGEKSNSDWYINHIRGILDHRMEQCTMNNIPDDGWVDIKQHLRAYNTCMDMALDEYIEEKSNSEWFIDYLRGILDWKIEYCSKNPYML